MARLPVHQTFGESANHLRLLHEKLFDLAATVRAPDEDARKVNLNNCLRATSAAEGSLRLMEWSRLGGHHVLIAGLGLAPPNGLTHFSEDLLRATKHFLVLEYQFQIEALLANILRALGQPVGSSFSQIVRTILGLLELDGNPQRQEHLLIPARIRNSMHANGVHGHGDTVSVIGDLEFRFERGRRVSCGHWEHVCVALSASVDAVGEIIGSGQVGALELVPDLYAAQL